MTLRDDLESEYVNIGGVLMQRLEAYRYLINTGASPKAAARLAWSSKAVPPAEVAAWPEAMRGHRNAIAADLIDTLGLGD